MALSNTEAEYMVLAEAAKETIYLRDFLKEIHLLHYQDQATALYCDNQGAGKLAKNPVFHSKTKHISNIKHHFVREIQEQGKIDVKYLPTNEMIADILTKTLSKTNHDKLTVGLGLDSTNK